ncbi:MAG: tRNA (N(6)-L-threonylcarbamoyladenosine(37)-C(2))-methylthiotransferase MtaB [Candidatus Omnitrophica bacterium]|nr:tRNA (N(6)-L-threonylcarbamoyladenosine(37)-C(2))-methylthiotransferase MtaB [Candidatus Omnitrophota bacterium]
MKKVGAKNIFVLSTLGCKVNQYETQALREQLLRGGLCEDRKAAADVYVINTCTVTHHADRESRRLIRHALCSNPQAAIIVTGCLVEKDASEIRTISDRIRIVPNQHKHHIMDFLKNTQNAKRKTQNAKYTPLKISDFKDHERAFIKIQDGCDNFCSYCKVPIVRGRSRSRSPASIKKEVRLLLEGGFKEIVLTGICLGDYRYREAGLADVLKALEGIKAGFRIRLSSIEPQLVSNKLLNVLQSPKICPHLHIPLQSGDDAVLKKMNRRYSRSDFLALVRKVKRKIKDIAITTDVLLGFPGEKEINFKHTVSCLQEILPLRTHIFSFSPREYTKAFNFYPRVEASVVKERMAFVKEVTAQCSLKFRRQFLNKRLTVLLESSTQRENGVLCGYTENYIRTIVEGAEAGDISALLPVELRSVDIDRSYARVAR